MDQLKTDLDFDDLLNLESKFIEIGREDGVKDGIKSGELEGQIIGCEKGFELLQEIGFYDGVVEMWIKILEKGWKRTAQKSKNER
ncbi:16085_t:CDS:2 [Acaulospora colombiana]|uniref:16085_t:CDS:1 n=1 Tax=Acaulospora colombiana TaxID=27376 RepID=A0ACA9L477_9GLOM|nr:16085_t:CDS:2 [Acaulospora colombiana]